MAPAVGFGYVKYRLMRVVFPVLGRLRAPAYGLASICGPLGLMHPGTRRTVRRTMAPLCSENPGRLDALTRELMRQAARYYVDLASLRFRDFGRLEADHLEVEHLERVAALDVDGPRIVIGGHTAGSELALQAFRARGYSFTGLVEQVDPPELSTYLLEWRRSAGGKFFEADRRGLRECLSTLEAGGLVVLMADRDIQGNGTCVEFFGRRVRFPRGPWELAARVGAPVVPFLCSRRRGDQIRVLVEEPILVDPGKGRADGVGEAAQRWAAVLERYLRRDPGQWIVLEDFWKVHACE